MEDDLTLITARPQFRCNYSAPTISVSLLCLLAAGEGTWDSVQLWENEDVLHVHSPPPHTISCLSNLSPVELFMERKDSSAQRPCWNCILTLVGLKEGWHEGSDNDSCHLLWDGPFDINQHTHAPEDNSNTGTDACKGGRGQRNWMADSCSGLPSGNFVPVFGISDN